MNESQLIFGPSGTGKSETLLTLSVPNFRLPLNGPEGKRRKAQLWVDMHGTTVQKAAKQAVKLGIVHTTIDGKPTFIYDKGADTEFVPSYGIVRSMNPNPNQHEAEQRNLVEELISFVLAPEGKMDATGTQYIRQGLTDAFNIFVWQKPGRNPSLAKLCDVFVRGQTAYEFIAGCSRLDVIQRIERYHRLQPLGQDWDRLCGPAYRRLKPIPESTQLRARFRDNPLDMAPFYNRGGILMYDGESEGNLNRVDSALNANLLIQNTIQLARSRKLTRDLEIIVDEPLHGGILNMHLARGSAEFRKWRVSLRAAIQSPKGSADPRVMEELIGNCPTVFVHQQVNPDATTYLARMFSQRSYDSLEVHYEEEIKRLVEEEDTNKWLRIETESNTESVNPNGFGASTTRGFILRPVKREQIEIKKHIKTPQVKDREWEHTLTNLSVGEVVIRSHDAVTDKPFPMPMLPRPWGDLKHSRHPLVWLEDKKLADALDIMRQRPEYQGSSPSQSWDNPPPPSTGSAADRLDAGEL
ncbi:MAG TPA: hypothetical protein VHR66_27905 [Gemmataceae bacterium]|jgi:hypothetical protein|nr:hypothetical protein [Gemmataceae bacterium]